MQINHLIQHVTGPFETETGKLVCVQNPKYNSVELCFKANNGNVPFTGIKLHSRDRHIDAKATFPDAVNLGNEIVRRWNEHQPEPTPQTELSVSEEIASCQAIIQHAKDSGCNQAHQIIGFLARQIHDLRHPQKPKPTKADILPPISRLTDH